jgi:hypothetical protein
LTVNLCKIVYCNFFFFIRSFFHFIKKIQGTMSWKPPMPTRFTLKSKINFIYFFFIFICYIFKIKSTIFFYFFIKIIFSW